MADHVGNSSFVIKLDSVSFHIQKWNLRPTLFPVAYFKLCKKQASFYPNNMIVVIYWFQYETA